MPVPMIAPMPSIVRSRALSDRLSWWCAARAAARRSSTDFVRKRGFMQGLAGAHATRSSVSSAPDQSTGSEIRGPSLGPLGSSFEAEELQQHPAVMLEKRREYEAQDGHELHQDVERRP